MTSLLTFRAAARCCALAVFSASAAFAAKEPSLVHPGQAKSYAYSWQDELKLGAEADQQIVAEMGLYDDPALQAYVTAVGERVLAGSQFNEPNAPEIYRNTKFTFRVIDSPVVNAFALPGGYVYVTRGLLAHVQNEAQLAVVLGHEIAHVAARHSSQQARRSQWGQLGVIAGAILGQTVLGEKMPNIGETILQGGGQAAQLLLLRHSREAEFESDNLGVAYAARMGYSAADSARFFQSLQRLSAADGKSLPTWQSTHPDPGDRAQRVQQIAAKANARADNLGEAEYLKHIEGLVVGENPREGFARDGVFYHPELRFQLPVAAGWKLDNQKAAVVMAEPNRKAVIGLRLAPGTRARDAASQFAQKAKVQVLTSGDTQVNGLPTTVLIGQASTEQGTVGVWHAFIEYDNKVYSLLGYAPQQVFEQVRPTFESVAAGFSPLRDRGLAALQPARLRLVRAERGGAFASYVPTSLPEGLEAEEVAIMNQVALNEAVPEGKLLKVPDSAVPAAALANPITVTRQPDYRQAPAAYPPANYPPQRYPQGSAPQPGTYPSNYPPQPGNYPPPAYPPGNYPGAYPQGAPQPSGAPPAYPPAGYPAGTSPHYPASYPPGTPYPQGQAGYPPGAPNFPQPPGAGSQAQPPGGNPSAPPPPTWPR